MAVCRTKRAKWVKMKNPKSTGISGPTSEVLLAVRCENNTRNFNKCQVNGIRLTISITSSSW
jgi:hypothetical protein